jgi:hypothetical protein
MLFALPATLFSSIFSSFDLPLALVGAVRSGRSAWNVARPIRLFSFIHRSSIGSALEK